LFARNGGRAIRLTDGDLAFVLDFGAMACLTGGRAALAAG